MCVGGVVGCVRLIGFCDVCGCVVRVFAVCVGGLGEWLSVACSCVVEVCVCVLD